MTDLEKYLQQLRYELRAHSERERTEIIAEIQSHIESGLADEMMGKSDAEQTIHLLQELGSPTELAQNLQKTNWKHNLLYTILALMPLLLFNLLGDWTSSQFGYTPFANVSNFVIQLLLSAGLVFLARHLGSKLLQGWWLGYSMGIVFNAVIFSNNWPFHWFSGIVWSLTPILLVIIVGGFYGRFLWQNRHDGLVITLALIPFMWGLTVLMTLNSVLVEDYVWRSMWTAYLSVPTFIIVAAAAFMPPQRKQRWGALIIGISIYTIAVFALWFPNPNSVLWLTLWLPLLLGISIESTVIYTHHLQLTSR